jgi:hypothetical protein
MPAVRADQRNPYKGSPPRPWVRLRFTAADGATHSCELLADTGNPCAVIIGKTLMATLKLRAAPDVSSNFGLLEGGWVHLSMPELALDQEVVGFGSDAVVSATKKSSPEFEGLAGLPFLRLLEYGGDADSFWLRSVATPP